MSNFAPPTGGTVEIGTSIGSLTAGSVLFGGTLGVLAQNNAAFKWDEAIHGMVIGDPADVMYPYWLIARGSGGTTSSGYNDVNFILKSSFSGAYLQAYKSLYLGDFSNSHAILSTASNSTTDPTLTVLAINAGKSPLRLKLAASQTANAFEVTDSSDNLGFYITADPANYGIGFGSAGGGHSIRCLSNNLQLVSSFNACLQVALYGAGFHQNAYVSRNFNTQAALTSGVAKTIATISLGTLQSSSGVIQISIVAKDATDIQCRTQIVRWEAVNKGGVYTTNVTVVSEGVAASTGTLTGTWAVVTGTNSIELRLTATTSLTPTSFICSFTGDNMPNTTNWASS